MNFINSLGLPSSSLSLSTLRSTRNIVNFGVIAVLARAANSPSPFHALMTATREKARSNLLWRSYVTLSCRGNQLRRMNTT